MIRKQILLTPTLEYEVKQYAKEKDISFSAAIRTMLEKATNAITPKKNSGVEALLKMAENAKSVKGAPKDLSSNDDYIYGPDAP